MRAKKASPRASDERETEKEKPQSYDLVLEVRYHHLCERKLYKGVNTRRRG